LGIRGNLSKHLGGKGVEVNPGDVVRIRQIASEMQKITSASYMNLPEIMAVYELAYELKKIGSDLLIWSINEEKKLWKNQ
jgi:hypothetical protein